MINIFRAVDRFAALRKKPDDNLSAAQSLNRASGAEILKAFRKAANAGKGEMNLDNINTVNTTENARPDVILAVMKLTRSMRRRSHRPEEGGMPGMGRPLSVIADNEGVSSRELAELMDIRPSSLTEMLSRLENDGLIVRTTDSEDRRVTRVSLSDKGRELAVKMKAEHEQRVACASACFTDEEAAEFCRMCERLAAHLESMAKEGGDFMTPPPHMHGFGHGPGRGFHGGGFPEEDGHGGHGCHGPHHPRHRKLR